MPNWYHDDPKYYAKVTLNGREIRLRETPESSAFLQSLGNLTDAEQLLGASIWMCQQSVAFFHVDAPLTLPPSPMTVQGMHIQPFTTPEGEPFFRSVEAVSNPEKRQAIGMFLNEIGKQLLGKAIAANPKMFLNDARCEQE